MTERRTWRIRLAFEPNRFSREQLVKVYEQLKPTDSRATSAQATDEPAATTRPGAKQGGQ